MPYPGVGVCVVIYDEDSMILMGKRESSHGIGTWSWPGGKQDYGESWEQTARRETLEETGLVLPAQIDLIGATDNYFPDDGKHFTTIIMRARLLSPQTPKALEPTKCKEWLWFNAWDLPHPLFQPIVKFLAMGHIL